MSTLSPPVREALRELGSSLRGLGDPTLLAPATLDTDAAARAWAAGVAPRLRALAQRRAAEKAQAEAAAAPEPPGAVDPWKAVDDAFVKLEAEMVGSPALKARLAEGRRSMASKAERVVQEHLSARVELVGARASAGLDPEGVRALQDALPGWVLGWAEYTAGAYAVDWHRLVDRLWTGKDGELPVPRPPVAPLALPGRPEAPAFPTVHQTLDLEGLGGVLKHARSVLYGMMSLGVVFGLRAGSGVSPLVLGALALGAAGLGYVQHRAERASRIERFEAEVARRAEAAVKAVLSAWYDRQNDKLLEHFTAELHERRAALIAWHRAEVAPRRARDERAAAARRAAVEAARKQLAELERGQRELDRAQAALRPLLEA
jgi:hypothetical protein